MHLRRLKISSLPGIKPEFTFEPGSDAVNIVTGPNAIGKSSLIRALKYLLADVDRKKDPPGLILEGEFQSGDVCWTVRRTGRDVVWMRDGEAATPPTLPGADQFGLYRLSVESLLAVDVGDRELAKKIWETVRGGFDLDGARRSVGAHFGSAEARELGKTVSELGAVEGAHSVLRQDEAELPELERRIACSERAERRGTRLQTALDLHEATAARKARADGRGRFPVHMAQLRGDELEDLERLEKRTAQLREQRSVAERGIRAAGGDMESTGLQGARLAAEKMAGINKEEMAGIKKLLREAESDFKDLDRASEELKEAEAVLKEAEADLGVEAARPVDGGGTAGLNSDSLQRAREVVEPLVDAQFRRKELEQRLRLAGTPPDTSEIERFRDGFEALRAWLAARVVAGVDAGVPRLWFFTRVAWWATVTLGTLITAAAFWVEAWTLFGGALSAVLMLLAIFWMGHQGTAQAEAPMYEAKRRYADTDLKPPPKWSDGPVREHLRGYVQPRYDELRLREKLAEGVERIREDIEDADSEINELEARGRALAREIGIDPALTGAPFYRFVDVTSRFDEARAARAGKTAALEDLNERVRKRAMRIHGFLDEWRARSPARTDESEIGEELSRLRIAFDSLEGCMAAASEFRSLDERLAEEKKNVENLYKRAGLKVDARGELVQMLDQLGAWRQAGEDLIAAESEEKRLRDALSGENGLLESVERGEIDSLKSQLRSAGELADGRTGLIQKQSAIKARLEEACTSRKLEDAAREKGQAAAALRDRRDEALLCAATDVLLDDVEVAFKTEREPDLLRKARHWFERVTAHAFTLELRGADGFAARDRKQGELRTLDELSSGTRMQLLIALRLAWTEDRERGGESLPLFFDEALTTSDVDRFSDMARTMTSLADAGRQIFYLSARPHEAALWKQATGTAPVMIDLAAVRFGFAQADPDALRVETPAALPPPDGRAAEEYAALIGVHSVNPRVDAGGIHLFHLLRDDLDLLHSLLGTWRIGTLGQLESLLASDAARTAISDRQARRRLRQRTRAARSWTERWRQGRGRSVDRAALDQCPAVTSVFLDRAAGLAAELDGDGEALVRDLRAGALKSFFSRKTDELETWLADEGYVDDAATLDPDERRRLTLQHAASSKEADAEDVNRIVDWMESAVVG